MLGFGRTERSLLGEELFSADLRLVRCERSDWLYCVCGLASAAAPRGVCSGDSGGPVLYGGMPVGVFDYYATSRFLLYILLCVYE